MYIYIYLRLYTCTYNYRYTHIWISLHTYGSLKVIRYYSMMNSYVMIIIIMIMIYSSPKYLDQINLLFQKSDSLIYLWLQQAEQCLGLDQCYQHPVRSSSAPWSSILEQPCGFANRLPLMNHHLACKVAKTWGVYLWRSTVFFFAAFPCIPPYFGYIPMPHALSTLTHSNCASTRRRAKLHRWQFASRDSSLALEDCVLSKNCFLFSWPSGFSCVRGWHMSILICFFFPSPNTLNT